MLEEIRSQQRVNGQENARLTLVDGLEARFFTVVKANAEFDLVYRTRTEITDS